jgi:predicted AAA+ superfamily ATPase
MVITNKLYTRTLFEFLYNNLAKNSALIVYGPRQTGKTTILKEIKQDRS